MECVEKLDPMDQEIVLNRFVKGQSVSMISQDLGISAYFIKKRLAKLMKVLQQSFNELNAHE